MNLDEYKREKHRLYEEFAQVIASIIKQAVATLETDFRVQQVQSRAKDPDSLKKKLSARGAKEFENVEEEVTDLAGCRIIFYYNDDVDRFLHSRLISENFNVDWDSSNFHQPSSETDAVNEL